MWPTIGKLVAALVAAGVLVAGLTLPYVGGVGLLAGHESDKFADTRCNLQESKPPQRTTLYANDGKTVIATLFSQDRVPIAYDQIPTYLRQALVATEDRRFYSHHGVDMRGLIRSAVSTSSGDTQGGSTLTMQYAKQIRYYQAGDDAKKQEAAVAQNLERKIEDAKCALYFENTLHESKNAILTNYLNIAFFGEHSYGVQTAAETYFNKPASKLTLGQSATLVGLLRAPSAYDPFVNREAATERRNEVLQNLVATKKITQEAADTEKAQPIALATQAPPQVKQGCANASSKVPNSAFFCDYAVGWLKAHNKLSDTQLNTGGLKIVTTLDPDLQRSAQERIQKAVPASSPMTAVLPATDPKSGNVLAMASSKRYGADGPSETEQPIFTSYTAQGASTFKLFPLLAALSIGVTPDWQLETAGGGGAEYKTKNCSTGSSSRNGDANESYNLNESLQTGTEKSSNTFFVGMADQLFNCKLGTMVDIAQNLGMKSLSQASEVKKQTIGQALVSQQSAQRFVLGFVPTSPLELAGAYGAVANGGRFYAPTPILSITDNNGNAVAVQRTPPVQAVAPYVAAEAEKILEGDTQGDGTSARRFQDWYANGDSTVAGKTGTNESNKKDKNSSIWFVGMTPNLVAASGLINFDSSSTPSTGLPDEGKGEAYGDYAAKVWLSALGPYLSKKSWTWDAPATVGGQDVPDVTGQSIDDARRNLADSSFKMKILDEADMLRCPGPGQLDTVAYYGPHRATAGSTITVCPSLGREQPVYSPPVVVSPRRNGNNNRNRNGNRNRTTTRNGNGGSGNGGTGNGGTGNGGTGNGGSGNGGSGNGGSGNGGGGGGTPTN